MQRNFKITDNCVIPLKPPLGLIYYIRFRYGMTGTEMEAEIERVKKLLKVS